MMQGDPEPYFYHSWSCGSAINCRVGFRRNHSSHHTSEKPCWDLAVEVIWQYLCRSPWRYTLKSQKFMCLMRCCRLAGGCGLSPKPDLWDQWHTWLPWGRRPPKVGGHQWLYVCLICWRFGDVRQQPTADLSEDQCRQTDLCFWSALLLRVSSVSLPGHCDKAGRLWHGADVPCGRWICP
jgi:hypothetical protein